MNNKGRRIGDGYLRIPRLKEFRVPLYLPKSRYLKQLLVSNPVLVGVLGIAAAIVLGGGLLMLPFSNTQGGLTPPLTAFFTSASAVSTTGLSLVTTATYWTFFGQVVICVLIFLGGLGLVTVVMFNLWLLRSRLTLRNQILTREALVADNLEGLLKMLRNIVFIDLAITAIGASILFVAFRNYYNVPTSLWQSLFHSVSSFNTAGFDIVGPAGFIPLRADSLILSVCTIEQVLGALSFSVLIEVTIVRKWRRFSLNTKLVLLTTLVVFLVAIVAIFTNETFLGNTLNEFSATSKFFSSVFNGLSAATTTGYATIDFSQVTIQTLIIITVVMFIGGATGSTAGGVKVNSVSAIAASIWSTIKGKPNTEIFRKEIESHQVWRALTIILSSVIVVAIGMILIMLTSPDVAFESVLFEATSAFATCGLSTGALAEFSVLSQIVVIFLMFVGRVAPLSVALIFTTSRNMTVRRYPQELLKLG